LVQLGAEPLLPPISTCLFCPGALDEEKVVEGRLYTLHRGILPIWSKSLYCRPCHTRYYNNYYVRDAKEDAARREYYSPQMPDFIHVAEASYVEPQLCQYFALQMVQSYGTCQSIASVYNLAFAWSDLPNASRLDHELTGDLVLDSFFLHAILHDKQSRREPFSVPHHGYQNHRFDEALAQRNYQMAGTGQPMWAHACNRCMKIYQGDDGNWYRMTAGVHDGVNVRHFCCSVHDCTEALPSQRDFFCYTHRDLIKVCCIKDCNAKAQPGFRTCAIESHRAFQMDADERNAGMFQLRNRLHNAHIEPRVKGKLTRNWTHNEQLFVRCCGIIVSRATFFGSEGVTGVKTFLKATFPPEYPGALPSYIFYDNNCSFLKHLLANGDHYFDHVGLPVDVFHFKCKHSEADVFCQAHCNPARFRELITSDGKWVFNSSAAEQTNAWFGKFQNMVQDMPVLKYNFFLDEMIALHNEQVAAMLHDQGHAPHIQSESLLRGSAPFLSQNSA
ncbi:hypothetical protein C8R44DRAFT_650414, partial [Mycena epipterygia]